MRQSGYSLVELLAVMALLAVLLSLAAPALQIQRQREQERELRRALWELRDALDAYQRAALRIPQGLRPTASGYPPSLEALLEGLPVQGDDSRRERFLRRIPRDPFAPAEVPAASSWALRGYGEPGFGAEMGDVYDVQSRSQKRALDGRLLSEW